MEHRKSIDTERGGVRATCSCEWEGPLHRYSSERPVYAHDARTSEAMDAESEALDDDATADFEDHLATVTP